MSTREELTRLGERSLRLGKTDEAIAHYQALADLTPVDWNHVRVLGDLLERANQREAAARQFCRWADHLATEGFHSKASAIYKKVLKLEPAHEHALWQLGRVSLELKLRADARQYFQKVLDLRHRRGDLEGAAEAREQLAQLEQAPAPAPRSADGLPPGLVPIEPPPPAQPAAVPQAPALQEAAPPAQVAPEPPSPMAPVAQAPESASAVQAAPVHVPPVQPAPAPAALEPPAPPAPVATEPAPPQEPPVEPSSAFDIAAILSSAAEPSVETPDVPVAAPLVAPPPVAAVPVVSSPTAAAPPAASRSHEHEIDIEALLGELRAVESYEAPAPEAPPPLPVSAPASSAQAYDVAPPPVVTTPEPEPASRASHATWAPPVPPVQPPAPAAIVASEALDWDALLGRDEPIPVEEPPAPPAESVWAFLGAEEPSESPQHEVIATAPDVPAMGPRPVVPGATVPEPTAPQPTVLAPEPIVIQPSPEAVHVLQEPTDPPPLVEESTPAVARAPVSPEPCVAPPALTEPVAAPPASVDPVLSLIGELHAQPKIEPEAPPLPPTFAATGPLLGGEATPASRASHPEDAYLFGDHDDTIAAPSWARHRERRSPIEPAPVSSGPTAPEDEPSPTSPTFEARTAPDPGEPGREVAPLALQPEFETPTPTTSPELSTSAEPAQPASAEEVDLTELLDQLAALEDAHPSESPAPMSSDAGSAELDAVFADLQRHTDSRALAEQQLAAGRVFLAAGLVAEAARAFERASGEPRTRFAAAQALAELHRSRGQMDEAVRWYEAAAEAPVPDAADRRAVLYDLAESLEARGEHERALGVLLDLLSQVEDYRDARARLDRLLRVDAGG